MMIAYSYSPHTHSIKHRQVPHEQLHVAFRQTRRILEKELAAAVGGPAQKGTAGGDPSSATAAATQQRLAGLKRKVLVECHIRQTDRPRADSLLQTAARMPGGRAAPAQTPARPPIAPGPALSVPARRLARVHAVVTPTLRSVDLRRSVEGWAVGDGGRAGGHGAGHGGMSGYLFLCIY